MKQMSRKLIGGVILLVICWSGYFGVLWPRYDQQLQSIERSIEAGRLQIKALEEEALAIKQLEGQIQYLEWVAQGLKQQIPPMKSKVESLEDLHYFFKGQNAENVVVVSVEQGEEMAREDQVSTQWFEIGYDSSYEATRKILSQFQGFWQVTAIERLTLERVSEAPGKSVVHTQLLLALYFDDTLQPAESRPSLLQLVGKSQWTDRIPKEDGQEVIKPQVFALTLMTNSTGEKYFKIEGHEVKGEPLVMTSEGMGEITLVVERDEASYLFAFVNEEGEKVSQQIKAAVSSGLLRVGISDSSDQWTELIKIVVTHRGESPFVVEVPESVLPYVSVTNEAGEVVGAGGASQKVQVYTP